MTIGITGATGHLGRLVVNQLKAEGRGADIVALARTPSKAPGLAVETREADYDKPETLHRALQGVDALLLISANEVGKRAGQHRNVIDAAQKSGVKRIVYTSLLHAETSPLGLAGEHLGTERDIQASGIPFTILRNGWYTENYTASLPGALANGVLIGAAGEGRISSAARADYAEAAAVAITAAGHEGGVYELAGDDSYTLAGLAAEISRQTGKTIPYKNLSKAEYQTALTGFGLPEWAAQLYADSDDGASKGALFDNGRQLSNLIGRPTTPLATVVSDALRKSITSD